MIMKLVQNLARQTIKYVRRTVPRDVPQREYFQTELFYNMQEHWLKGPTLSSLPRKVFICYTVYSQRPTQLTVHPTRVQLKIPDSNGLTETDAVKKYYFKHTKWVDDSK